MDSAFQIREYYCSYATGEPLSASFVDLPLITDNLAHTPQARMNCMRTLLADAVLQSPEI